MPPPRVCHVAVSSYRVSEPGQAKCRVNPAPRPLSPHDEATCAAVGPRATPAISTILSCAEHTSTGCWTNASAARLWICLLICILFSLFSFVCDETATRGWPVPGPGSTLTSHRKERGSACERRTQSWHHVSGCCDPLFLCRQAASRGGCLYSRRCGPVARSGGGECSNGPCACAHTGRALPSQPA
jgi:hypothetical protein